MHVCVAPALGMGFVAHLLLSAAVAGCWPASRGLCQAVAGYASGMMVVAASIEQVLATRAAGHVQSICATAEGVIALISDVCGTLSGFAAGSWGIDRMPLHWTAPLALY